MMKRIRIRVAYISILVLFMLSIPTLKFDMPSLFKPIIVPEMPAYHECVNSAIPPDAKVLFFSRSDGSYAAEISTGDLYLLQYNLVPRVVFFQELPQLTINDFDWFIAYQMEPEELEEVKELNNLVSVKICETSEISKRDGLK